MGPFNFLQFVFSEGVFIIFYVTSCRTAQQNPGTEEGPCHSRQVSLLRSGCTDTAAHVTCPLGSPGHHHAPRPGGPDSLPRRQSSVSSPARAEARVCGPRRPSPKAHVSTCLGRRSTEHRGSGRLSWKVRSEKSLPRTTRAIVVQVPEGSQVTLWSRRYLPRHRQTFSESRRCCHRGHQPPTTSSLADSLSLQNDPQTPVTRPSHRPSWPPSPHTEDTT